MKDISMNISLLCSVCGNDQFSTYEDSNIDIEEASGETKVQCSDCGHVCSKDELIEDNQHIIDANVEDLKKEAIKEIEKKFSKMFK